jgi:hypothetical protein
MKLFERCTIFVKTAVDLARKKHNKEYDEKKERERERLAKETRKPGTMRQRV